MFFHFHLASFYFYYTVIFHCPNRMQSSLVDGYMVAAVNILMCPVDMLTNFSQVVLLVLESSSPPPGEFTGGRASPSECLIQWKWSGI